eukprot:g64177.t1
MKRMRALAVMLSATVSAAQTDSGASAPSQFDGAHLSHHVALDCPSCALCNTRLTSLNLLYKGEENMYLRALAVWKEKGSVATRRWLAEGWLSDVNNRFSLTGAPDVEDGTLGKEIFLCLFNGEPETASLSCPDAVATARIKTRCSSSNQFQRDFPVTDKDGQALGEIILESGCSEDHGGLAMDLSDCPQASGSTSSSEESGTLESGSLGNQQESYTRLPLVPISNDPNFPMVPNGAVLTSSASGNKGQSSNYNYEGSCGLVSCTGLFPPAINVVQIGMTVPCAVGSSSSLPPCSPLLCCTPMATCDPQACGPASIPIGNRDTYCRNPWCEYEECCVSLPTCQASSCPMGTELKAEGARCSGIPAGQANDVAKKAAKVGISYTSGAAIFPPGFTPPRTESGGLVNPCSLEDCCVRVPTCGEQRCPPDMVQTKPSNYRCASNKGCILNECCAPIPFCDLNACPTGFSPSQNSHLPCGYLRTVPNPFFDPASITENGNLKRNEAYEMKAVDTLLEKWGAPATECSLEECCQSQYHCGDYECGHDSVRIVDPSFPLSGGWKLEMCCAPLHRCKAGHCPADFVAVNVGNICIGALFNEPNPFNFGMESLGLEQNKAPLSAAEKASFYNENGVLTQLYGAMGNYRIPQECVLEECCRYKDRCGDFKCPPDHVAIAPPDHMAKTGFYDLSECCAPIPRCNGDCPPKGYVAINKGMACGSTKALAGKRVGRRLAEAKGEADGQKESGQASYSRPTPCLLEECCEKLPMCGDQGCGVDSVRIQPLEYVCQGFSCLYDECCAPLHRCGEAECPSGWRPSEERYGMVCGATYGGMNLGSGTPSQNYQGQYLGFNEALMESGLSNPADSGRRLLLNSTGNRRVMVAKSQGNKDQEFGALGSLSGHKKPEECSVEDCCWRMTRCGDRPCPALHVAIASPQQTSADGKYHVEECCAPLPRCKGECPPGYDGRERVGAVCSGQGRAIAGHQYERTEASGGEELVGLYGPAVGFKIPLSCAIEECCRRLDRCGDHACPADMVPIKPPDYMFASAAGYVMAECCAPIPRCRADCPAYGYVPINTGQACGNYASAHFMMALQDAYASYGRGQAGAGGGSLGQATGGGYTGGGQTFSSTNGFNRPTGQAGGSYTGQAGGSYTGQAGGSYTGQAGGGYTGGQASGGGYTGGSMVPISGGSQLVPTGVPQRPVAQTTTPPFAGGNQLQQPNYMIPVLQPTVNTNYGIPPYPNGYGGQGYTGFGSGYGSQQTGSGYGTGYVPPASGIFSGNGMGTGSQQMAPLSQPGYGSQTGTGYGSQQTGTGYGSQQTGTGYGSQQTGTGYGSQQTGTGYGSQQTGTGYGSQQTGTGYGTQQGGGTYAGSGTGSGTGGTYTGNNFGKNSSYSSGSASNGALVPSSSTTTATTTKPRGQTPPPFVQTPPTYSTTSSTTTPADLLMYYRPSASPGLNEEDANICVTQSGPRSGQRCVFPFLYLGVWYSACTMKDSLEAWCATDVDDIGQAYEQEWGNCGNCGKSNSQQESVGLEAAAWFGPPTQCLMEECCEKLPMCGDQGCGVDAVRIQPKDYICKGYSCVFEECCAPLHRCGSEPCPYGFVEKSQVYGMVCGPTYSEMNIAIRTPVNQMSNQMAKREAGSKAVEDEYGALGILAGYRIPEKCSVSECCIPLARCGDSPCPPYYYLSKPPSFALPTITWDAGTCCQEMPRCGPQVCGNGMRPREDAVGKWCDAFLRGGQGGQASTQGTKGRRVLSQEEAAAAAAAPAGDGQAAPSDQESSNLEFSWLPSPPVCSERECCTSQGRCGTMDCGYGQAQVQSATALCASIVCKKEECCAPIDTYHRFTGRGRYIATENGYCEDLGCDKVHSAEECEHASYEIQLSDHTVSPATQDTNPNGCYFRPNFQSLWFNPYGRSASAVSRNAICYCDLAVDLSRVGYFAPDYFKSIYEAGNAAAAKAQAAASSTGGSGR